MVKKEKDKHKKSKEDKANKSRQADSPAIASGSSYADGAPLDRVQYLEAKLAHGAGLSIIRQRCAPSRCSRLRHSIALHHSTAHNCVRVRLNG
jgi:hypothetical protein